MLNIKFYFRNHILPLIIEKFSITSYTQLPKIQAIKFINQFNNLKSLDDHLLLRFIEFLEILANQQVSVQNVKNTYKNRKKISTCNVVLNLRNKNMFSFLNYLVQNNLPNKLNGYSKLLYKVTRSGNVILLFNNADLFRNMPENLSTLKFNLVIEIVIQNTNYQKTQYIMNKIKL